VKEALKDKNFKESLKGTFGLELFILVITIVAALINRYVFLLYSMYGILVMYNGIKNLDFTVRRKYLSAGIVALFATAVSIIFLESKNILFLYWNILFITLGRQLIRIFRQIFEKENLNLFSFNCLVVYALANTVLYWTTFKNNRFNMLGIMNILVILSVFLEEKIFEHCRNRLEVDHTAMEYLFLKKFYIFIIPSLIELVFYLFNLIEF
jgi:hypothetical protein